MRSPWSKICSFSLRVRGRIVSMSRPRRKGIFWTNMHRRAINSSLYPTSLFLIRSIIPGKLCCTSIKDYFDMRWKIHMSFVWMDAVRFRLLSRPISPKDSPNLSVFICFSYTTVNFSINERFIRFIESFFCIYWTFGFGLRIYRFCYCKLRS